MIVDVLGTYGASGAWYQPGRPVRLLDTRVTSDDANAIAIAIRPGDGPGLPAGTVAVALSLTAPQPSDSRYLTAAAGIAGRRSVSNLNFAPMPMSPTAPSSGRPTATAYAWYAADAPMSSPTWSAGSCRSGHGYPAAARCR